MGLVSFTARTWSASEFVTALMLNGVRDNLHALRDALNLVRPDPPTPTTLTGTQNNFAVPAGRYVLLVCNNAAQLTITGFVAASTPTNGDVIEVVSKNAQVDFAHQNAGTTVATNRLFNFATSCAMSLVRGSARFAYDGTTWRMTAHEQGGWIDCSARATATPNTGSLTVALASARYRISGRTCTWNFYAQLTPTSGTITYADLINPVAGMTHGSSLHSVGALAYLGAASGALSAYGQAIGVGGLGTRLFVVSASGVANYGSGANQFLGSLTFEIQ